MTVTFTIDSWDEKAYDEFDDGRKMTRASIKKSFTGDVEGDGSLEYLMTYAEDGSATFVGMERVVGRLGDRSGSFVLQHVGTYEGGISRASLLVVPGSATGGLSGLEGEGSFVLGHDQPYTFTLDDNFE
ncbi:MAG: DUF3224 domain-containing protein [Anaerolineae bacterium]